MAHNCYAVRGGQRRSQRLRPVAALDRAAELRQQALLAYLDGDLASAIALCDEVLRMQPNDAEALRQRGDTYHMLGKLDRAALRVCLQDASARHHAALAYLAQGDFDCALIEINLAIELQPDGRLYCTRANAYRCADYLKRALPDYDRAIELDPAAADSYLERGIACRDKGQLMAAIRDFTRAIHLRRDDAPAYRFRAHVYFDAGRYDRAAHDFEHALALDPDDKAVRAAREQAHTRMKVR